MGKARDMEFSDILYEVKDGVGRVTINRPKVLNAFTPVTLQELITVFRDAAEDPEVGVMVLTGAGERAFCAGGDVNWEATDDFEEGQGPILAKELYAAFRDGLKPIIARINGYAIGGGHHLAYHCDFSIAAEHAVLGQNGPRVASPAEGWLVAYLAEIVGVKRAKEMWMLCRRYSAKQAYDWGLVNSVVPVDELDAEVDKWCQELLALSPTVLKLVKKSFDDAFKPVRDYEDTYPHPESPADFKPSDSSNARRAPYLDLINPKFFESGEQKEGSTAFLEKRTPDFSKWR